MQDVTVDREKYIGGSDIPIIMSISPLKTRYALLLEKAEISKHEEVGNDYTEYGKIMESKIRDYINSKGNNFIEDKTIVGDLRYHSDGFNGTEVLEIKTTSLIHDSLHEYKSYLAQLLFGMKLKNVDKGTLAVYKRPDDFKSNTEFNPLNLYIYNVDINDFIYLVEEIDRAVESFREDIKRLKTNPFLTEEELQPQEIIVLSNKIQSLDFEISKYNKIVAEYDNLKKELYDAMVKYDVTKWVTNNGVQITKVAPIPPSIKQAFDEKTFKNENIDLYKKYLIDKQANGKAGYIKITQPKEKDNG